MAHRLSIRRCMCWSALRCWRWPFWLAPCPPGGLRGLIRCRRCEWSRPPRAGESCKLTTALYPAARLPARRPPQQRYRIKELRRLSACAWGGHTFVASISGTGRTTAMAKIAKTGDRKKVMDTQKSTDCPKCSKPTRIVKRVKDRERNIPGGVYISCSACDFFEKL